MAALIVIDPYSALTIHQKIALDRDKECLADGFSWTDIVIFRNYARGNHKTVLTDKQKEILRNLISNKFCDNVCHDIISQTIGRINFVKYECKDEAISEWISNFYTLSKILDRQSDIHYRTIRDGNHAVLVRWSNKKKRVEIVKQDWWNGTSGTFIHYSDVDEVKYAVKEWQEKDGKGNVVYRRLVWYEDKLERYMSNSSGEEDWVLINLSSDKTDDEEDDTGVSKSLNWLDKDGEPLGVPYIHFKNSNKTTGNYGHSELDGGVIGFQDQINDIHFGLSMTGRLTSGQMYYATGVKLKKKDGTQEYISPKTEPGAWHTSENEKSTFGVLQAGDPDKVIKILDTKLKRVASMTQTPMHFITGGDWPAAEALLRAEQPALNKARRQINSFRSAWVEMVVMAIKIHNVFSDKPIEFDISKGIIDAVFDDPENRDIVSRSIVVHNAGPALSERESLRILDYPEEKVQQIYEEKLEEQRDAADMVAQAVSRGNPPTQRKNAVGDTTPK